MTTTEFDNPFLQAISDRIHKKRQNVLVLIVGDPGTGKSLLALKIASKLDPTFNENTVRERVIVQPEQFAKLVSDKSETKLEKGAAIIIDEAGAAALGSRDWYSTGNKMISYILQTFRYRQLVLIMTVPNMSFVDIHARKLVNFLIETQKINFIENKTKARVWRIVFNKVKGDADPYRQRFRVKNVHGETVILDAMWFSRCDVKLAHAYEKYSYEFKQGIAEKSLRTIMRMQTKNDKKDFDVDDIVSKVVERRDEYVKYYNGKQILDRAKIENDFTIGRSRSSKVISKAAPLIL